MTGRAQQLRDALAPEADNASARFAGHHRGRLPGSATVHGVQMQAVQGLGLHVPGPSCHVGIGIEHWTAFEPTDDPITCQRAACVHAARNPPKDSVDVHQMLLDLDVPQGPGQQEAPTGT
ncbi:hypothetical protein [Saccharothrix xinjiangensis]|uniref:Uncharacterized protein n=1 Tax=Saccharothrix xinjiangensis TaxID=204798 RepID=A0ABV9XT78_9PSEU